jgi:K+-transporting ATPase ATPase B chain
MQIMTSSHPAARSSQSDPTSLLPKKLARSRPLFAPAIVGSAIRASFGKLNPIALMKNPVMFVVGVGAALTTAFLILDLFRGAGGIGFSLQIALWLWFTVLFANFAEGMTACARPRSMSWRNAWGPAARSSESPARP